jgi:hypothetical protein
LTHMPGDYVSYSTREAPDNAKAEEQSPCKEKAPMLSEMTDSDQVESTYANVKGLGIGDAIVTQAPGSSGEAAPVVTEPESLL